MVMLPLYVPGVILADGTALMVSEPGVVLGAWVAKSHEPLNCTFVIVNWLPAVGLVLVRLMVTGCDWLFCKADRVIGPVGVTNSCGVELTM